MSVKRYIGIVDDDHDVPIALSSLLRSIGYSTKCFASGPALLECDCLSEISCVISDIHMPGMSGLQLATRLRQIDPDLPIILMTGRNDPGLESAAYASGATLFVTKPFSADSIGRVIYESRALQRKSNNRNLI